MKMSNIIRRISWFVVILVMIDPTWAKDEIILDGWRRAGRLFWCPVIKGDEYEVEQHYGHSGITAWKENMQWSAWLQDYETGKSKSKTATNNKVNESSSAHEERASNSDSRQPATQ